MRTLGIIFLSLFLSCNSSKKTKEVQTKLSDTTMDCPNRGNCDFSVEENTNMRIAQDGTGANYPTFEKSPNTSIVKFRFHKETPEGMADGNYTEEIYMEIKNDVHELSLENEALQQVKLLYGRMCFCEKGTTGYFPVTEGTLEYRRNKSGEASIVLSFQNNQVPQNIEKIAGKVSFGK